MKRDRHNAPQVDEVSKAFPPGTRRRGSILVDALCSEDAHKVWRDPLGNINEAFRLFRRILVAQDLRPLGDEFVEKLRPFGKWSLEERLPSDYKIDLFGSHPDAVLAFFGQVADIHKRFPGLSFDQAKRLTAHGPIPRGFWRKWRLLPEAAASARDRIEERGVLERVRTYVPGFGKEPLSARALRGLAGRWARRELGLAGCFFRSMASPSWGAIVIYSPVALVVVDPRLSKEDRLEVLAHEVGHLLAGHCTPAMAYSGARGQNEPMEAEAELLSRMALGRTVSAKGKSEMILPKNEPSACAS